jgi:hypothetical protein
MKHIVLTPKEEAYMICYIALYYNCDKKTCWKHIAKIIEKYGVLTHKIVYRGQSKKDSTIKQTTPFISTTPNKRMADLFVERNWSLPEEKQQIGHLFKIHLNNAKCLSTRSIDYTLTDDVKDELRKINKDRPIVKGGGTYTLDEYFPKLKGLIEELVFADEAQNGEEILVLTGGTFYKNSSMKTKGFTPIGTHDFETWYSCPKYNKTRKHA